MYNTVCPLGTIWRCDTVLSILSLRLEELHPIYSVKSSEKRFWDSNGASFGIYSIQWLWHLLTTRSCFFYVLNCMSSVVSSNHPPDAHIFLIRPPQHQRASPVSGSQSTLNTNITMASGNSNLSDLSKYFQYF